MAKLSLRHAGMCWQVRVTSDDQDAESIWSFFSRAQAVDFLSSRFRVGQERNETIDLGGICFSELTLVEASRDAVDKFEPYNYSNKH